jgi:hypothetical protein
MEFLQMAWLVVSFGFIALVASIIVWWIIAMIGDFNAGMHNLDLSYTISREDRESLSKEDYKKTQRMTHAELTAFLTERFPNSIPEISTCEGD